MKEQDVVWQMQGKILTQWNNMLKLFLKSFIVPLLLHCFHIIRNSSWNTIPEKVDHPGPV